MDRANSDVDPSELGGPSNDPYPLHLSPSRSDYMPPSGYTDEMLDAYYATMPDIDWSQFPPSANARTAQDWTRSSLSNMSIPQDSSTDNALSDMLSTQQTLQAMNVPAEDFMHDYNTLLELQDESMEFGSTALYDPALWSTHLDNSIESVRSMNNRHLEENNISRSPPIPEAPTLPSDASLPAVHSSPDLPPAFPSDSGAFVPAEEGTFASRHPEKPRQAPKQRGSKTNLSNAEKASRALKQKDGKEMRTRMLEKILAAKEGYEITLADIAKDFGKNVKYVQALANSVKSRSEGVRPTMWNALSAEKARELNDGTLQRVAVCCC